MNSISLTIFLFKDVRSTELLIGSNAKHMFKKLNKILKINQSNEERTDHLL